jgi:hypothetical protein
MQDYRAYSVGPAGHFNGYRILVCGGDGEAIEKAKELFEGPRLSFGVVLGSSLRFGPLTEVALL